ncbi:hypothetical protein HK104_001510 [Borealophlyctis nickersoniae]|nr:hypothetical protein HK104_001510 [Borealophlyctis nickersoniae]
MAKIGDKADPESTTRAMIRDFIAIHNTVRQLAPQLREAKKQRREIEEKLTPRLRERKIDTLDFDGYRLYRYDDRLMPYHLAKDN